MGIYNFANISPAWVLWAFLNLQTNQYYFFHFHYHFLCSKPPQTLTT